MKNPFQHKLDEMFQHLSLDISRVASQEEPLVFQLPSKSFIFDLCDRVQFLFSVDPTVIELTSPIAALGDIHGHYLDLIRIIQVCGHPSVTKYLFLGDVVDRGEFSLETILLIFLMKVCYPSNIFLIRGNHEFDALCYKYGFYNEIYYEYQDKRIYNSFLKAFSYIPIAAIVDEVTICVHGGIGPNIPNIDVIKSIHRPIENFSSPITGELFWSDPNSTVTDFKASPRGTGFLFGKSNLLDFLEASQAARIVRGHECIREGYSTMFDERVLTMFSASNYCGTSNNESAVLIMDPNGEDEVKRFPPLPYFKRCFAIISKTPEDEKIEGSPSIGSSFSAGSVLLKSVVGGLQSQNNNKTRNVTMALHRLQQLNQKQQSKMSQSTSCSAQKWSDFNSQFK